MTNLDSLDHFFDDFSVGDTYVSRARTMTETDIVVFTGLSGDYSPLHTDEEFARRGPFGGRVAQGTLIIAVASGLTYALSSPGEKILAFYGLDRVRFLYRVAPGDTIHVRGTIEELLPREDKTGIVARKEEIVNQDGKVVAVLKKRTLQKMREYTA